VSGLFKKELSVFFFLTKNFYFGNKKVKKISLKGLDFLAKIK